MVGEQAVSTSRAAYASAAPFAFAPEIPWEEAELDSLLRGIFSTVETAHGDLGIGEDVFYERVRLSAARHLGPDAEMPEKARFIKQLYAPDLYLATACAEGSERAWIRFLELHDRYIGSSIRAACWNAAIVDELLAAFAADLFLPAGNGTSRIGSYDGCCPLRLWLRTVIANRAINEGERLRRYAPADEDARADLMDPAPAPDTSIQARRFADEFETCLASAFGALPERERSMIFLRFAKDVDLAGISRVYGVHQSTVSRTIERALGRMREHIRMRFPACADLQESSLDAALNSVEISRVDPIALLSAMCPGVAEHEARIYGNGI
jgi:RNA polymerase sigma-70 factor